MIIEPLKKTVKKGTTVWLFGERRVWLNPGDTSCKAAIVWHVSIVLYDMDNREQEYFLDCCITSTDDEIWYSTSRLGELRPVQRTIRELQKYEATVKGALAWAKANNIQLRD